MQTDEQIYNDIQELEKRQASVSELVAELQHQHDLETRVEEQHRLDRLISTKQITLDEIASLIQTKTPENYSGIQRKVLTNNAHQLKRNGAYHEAQQAWNTIVSLFPDDPQTQEAKESIDLLERLLQEQENVKELRKRLTQRLKDIRPVFNAVINRLNKITNPDDEQVMLQTIEMFVNKELSAEDFIENWETISTDPVTNSSFDYAALARRIQRDEMILFLGADIPAEYDPEVIEDTDLVHYLAQEAKIDPLTSSLSAVAEYYELRDDYSRSILLEKLNKKLPDNHKQVAFYSSLATIKRPLILITTAYDSLLENTFTDNNKPFVELSSIVNRSDEHDIGSVVVRYSDGKNGGVDQAIEDVCNEEKLSNLNLLEKGYSLIYKIRGTCDEDNASSAYSPRQDAMTLMESDYFKFARYADRIIPGYIAKQFRTRDFLFLGYQPRNWEDRLLVNAVLEKQRDLSSRNCLMIGECSDPFEKAYWDKRKVKRYNVNIRHLDSYLKQEDG